MYVESAFPSGGRLGGTGVMVGPNDVLTASHLLYSAQQGGAATSVKVVAAYNSNLGFTPYGEASSTSFHYHSDYDPNGDGLIAAGDGNSGLSGSELDVGIIDLSTALGQQTGWMTMDPGFASGAVNVSGYSASAGWKLLSGVSDVTDDGTDSITYTPNISLTPGNSGGPLWYQGSDGGHVVAVISTPGWAADVRGTIAELQSWVSGNDYLIAGASQTPAQPAPAPAPATTDQSAQPVPDTVAVTEPAPAPAPVPAPVIETTPTPVDTSGPVPTPPAVQVESTPALTGTERNDVLTGTDSGDTMRGEDGLDRISGNGGDDALYGGPRHDLLDGGAGSDMLDGGSGYDIAAFGARGGYGYNYVNGTLRVTDYGTGAVDTLKNIEQLKFTDGMVLPNGATTGMDFSGDGQADLVVRNQQTGALEIRNVDGTSISSTGTPDHIAGTEWTTAGTGDFNGDGRGDILWRYDGGMLAMWQMNGTSVVSGGYVQDPGPSQQVAGIGDFNADGKSDLLLRGNDGSVTAWLMNGNNVASSASLGSQPANQRAGGVGDFNGDHKADILWQADDGTVSIWQMDGSSVVSRNTVAQASTDWRLQGVGDFDGDGRSDVLWRQDGGTVSVWLMNGSNIEGGWGASSSGSPAGSAIAAIGDYNGDHKSDLLWQDADGSLRVELMNGLQSQGIGTIGSVTADWSVA